MEAPHSEVRFVEVNRPGHTRNAEDEWARRSHVRRATIRNQKGRPFVERMRFVDPADISRAKKTAQKRKAKGKPRSISPVRQRPNSLAELAPAAGTSNVAVALATPIACTSSSSLVFGGSPSLVCSLTYSHPHTHVTAKCVQIPPDRLDALFKSDAFRTASEPCFDSSHVDATLNMHAVFPGCADEPVFLNALVYATVQDLNHGTVSMEGLLLKSKAIRLLNEKLSTSAQLLSPSVIGAIMILKSVAYKYVDLEAHRTHTRGLMKALKVCSGRDISVTEAAKRAIFWLDLFGAMITGSERQLSHFALPPSIFWQHERLSDLALSLPIGFVRHRNSLPRELLECICDTVELQSFLRLDAISQLPHHAKYHQLDTMQASIESRLGFQTSACRQFGEIAEAVRLGVFIVCYCSWMDTWNSSLIPSRMAEKLIKILEPLVAFGGEQLQRAWPQRMEVFLWLLLVVSSVGELSKGHVEGLKSRQSRLVHSVMHLLIALPFLQVDLRSALQSALNDFICCEGWLERRRDIKEWLDLEQTIDLLPMTFRDDFSVVDLAQMDSSTL
jgi:hypothetical protein